MQLSSVLCLAEELRYLSQIWPKVMGAYVRACSGEGSLVMISCC